MCRQRPCANRHPPTAAALVWSTARHGDGASGNDTNQGCDVGAARQDIERLTRGELRQAPFTPLPPGLSNSGDGLARLRRNDSGRTIAKLYGRKIRRVRLRHIRPKRAECCRLRSLGRLLVRKTQCVYGTQRNVIRPGSDLRLAQGAVPIGLEVIGDVAPQSIFGLRLMWLQPSQAAAR